MKLTLKTGLKGTPFYRGASQSYRRRLCLLSRDVKLVPLSVKGAPLLVFSYVFLLSDSKPSERKHTSPNRDLGRKDVLPERMACNMTSWR
jgi:hypothetical protein